MEKNVSEFGVLSTFKDIIDATNFNYVIEQGASAKSGHCDDTRRESTKIEDPVMLNFLIWWRMQSN